MREEGRKEGRREEGGGRRKGEERKKKEHVRDHERKLILIDRVTLEVEEKVRHERESIV